ncbi:MAG: hypothetical protein A3B66_08550 [Alphaproteobacteria bacterium RIFCSPHIGHO2_02_FULL_46_13]|nr:MAG: hypothetical protein A3B66_08550 [Alphaproteobacteria bacterium RIFCSPHIGHO2_02_FULL_46_13]
MSDPISHFELAHGDAAQGLLARGFYIFPLYGIKDGNCTCGKSTCNRQGKHPATQNGLKDATCDLGRFIELVSSREHFNIGIATGSLSKVFVIDIDGLEGEEALVKSCPILPETLTCRTGRGRHMFFQLPEGASIKSRPILPKVDCKAEGGYVVSAGSRHLSGTIYSWIDPKATIAEAPPDLLRLVNDPPRKKDKAKTRGDFQPHHQPLSAALDAKEGSRNSTAFSSACQLLREGRTENDIRTILSGMIASGFDETEIIQTIESARRAVADENNGSSVHIDLISAASLIPEKINWLWDGYIARGKLHLHGGPAGTAKTTVALKLAATISAGGTWPDGVRAIKAPIAIWSGEDGVRDTLLPRLIAAGADRQNCHFIGDVKADGHKRAFDPATDILALIEPLRKLRPALLIVDPITQAVVGDSHKNSETRRGLAPLVNLAEELGIALWGITHFSKNTSGRAPLDRFTGSLAFGAVARLAFANIRDAETGERVFCRVKSNLGLDGGGFTFSLANTEIEGDIQATSIEWGDTISGTAADILARAERDPESRNTGRMAACDFLREELRSGPVAVNEIKSSAENAGFSWSTIRRAQKELGIRTRKIGFGGGWLWESSSSNADFIPVGEEDLLEAMCSYE